MSRNTATEASFRSAFDSATPSGGNYSSGRGMGFSGGRSAGGGLIPATVPGGGIFLVPNGGGFAQPSRGTTYSGREYFTTTRGSPAVPFTARNAYMFRHIFAAARQGGTAPAESPRYGRRIRDQLTWESVANAPPSEQRLAEVPDRRTHAEILQTRITAHRDRALADAWTLIGEKQFTQALQQFEAAVLADRGCTEGRVGIFCAALLDGTTSIPLSTQQYYRSQRAEAMLARIMRSDPGVFQLGIDLPGKLKDPALLERVASITGRATRQDSEGAAAVAVNAFYLWLMGHRTEALRLADQIHRTHRTSRFARMAARMRGEIASASEEEDAFADPEAPPEWSDQ